jgi:hypothetical protein
MNEQEFYNKNIKTIKVDNFLGFIPLDRDYERLAVEQFNDTVDDFHAMKLVKATAGHLTFTGMSPDKYNEYRELRGY